MLLPMQIVDQDDIAQADSLFRANLENRVEKFSGMSWGDRFRLIGDDLLHVGLKIIVAVAIIIVGRWLIQHLVRGIEKLLEKGKVDPAIRTFIRSVIKTLLYFVLFYAAIAWLGVDTSLFVAVFAAAGLAIGMAMSGVFQNIAGGVMVLTMKPFRCGDWIEIEGQAGTVMDIRLFSTILRTADNRTILLPNSGVFNSVVGNHTLARTRRVEWPISLDIGADYDAVSKALMELVAADKRIHTIPAPEVVMARLSPGSIDLLVHGWVATADYWDVFYKMNAAIYKTLTAKGFDLGSTDSLKVKMVDDLTK